MVCFCPASRLTPSSNIPTVAKSFLTVFTSGWTLDPPLRPASSVKQKCSCELTSTCEISGCTLAGTHFSSVSQELNAPRRQPVNTLGCRSVFWVEGTACCNAYTNDRTMDNAYRARGGRGWHCFSEWALCTRKKGHSANV